MVKTYKELSSVLEAQKARTDIPVELKDGIVEILEIILGYDAADMMSGNGIQDFLHECNHEKDGSIAEAAKKVYTLIYS